MYTNQEQLQNYKSIAIMGGTFDPIHYGHLATAEAVLHRFNVDKIIFMPTGHSYMKENGEGEKVTPNEQRFMMTSLATVRNKNFLTSRIEIDRKGKTYTVDTIEEIRKLCGPDVHIYFITGADAIEQIMTWKNPEKLFSLCDFIAVTRPGYNKNKLYEEIGEIMGKYKSRIYYMQVPALEISSSDIRKRVAAGQPIKYLLPESVEEYIEKFGLYKKPVKSEVKFMLDKNVMQEKLQSSLSIKRYIHTLGVVKEAKKLAKIYGNEETKDKAEVAALLHDCAKDYPLELKKRLCKEYHIELDDIIKSQMDLAHPLLGAEVAKREYLVDDEEILNAIKYHTTGKRKMSLLDKIVFIADYIEENRKPFEGLEEARRLAYIDLDLAMKFILEHTIEYVNERNMKLHPLSVEALEYYKNK